MSASESERGGSESEGRRQEEEEEKEKGEKRGGGGDAMGGIDPLLYGGSLREEFLSNCQAQVDAMSLPSSDNDQEDKGTEGEGEDARGTGGQGDIRTEGEASTTSSDATHHVGAAHSNEPTGPVKRRGTAEDGSGANDEPVSKRRKGKSRPQVDVSPAAGTGLPDRRSLPDDVRVRMKSRIKLYNFRGDGSRTFAWKKPFRNHKVGLHDEAWGGMFSTYKIEPLLAEVWGLVGADWERYVETQDEEEHEG